MVNAPARQRPSGLERSGSGLGLAGMRDRVAACGGSLTAGPTQAGGWQVSALLPVAPAAVLRADGGRTNSGVSVLAKPAGSGRMKQGPLHV